MGHDEVLSSRLTHYAGYDLSPGSALAISCQSPWKVEVEPVKCKPAKSGFESAIPVISAPDPGDGVITPETGPLPSSVA